MTSRGIRDDSWQLTVDSFYVTQISRIWSAASSHWRDGLCRQCRVAGIGGGVQQHNIKYVWLHLLILFQYGMADMNGVHHILDIASTNDTIDIYLISQFSQQLLVMGFVESRWKSKLHKWAKLVIYVNYVNYSSEYSTAIPWNLPECDVRNFASSKFNWHEFFEILEQFSSRS